MSTTYTSTYTVLDIRHVLDSFAADYDMIAQSTGLDTRTHVADVIHDVRLFCESEYLSILNIVLQDGSGKTVQARKYEISISAYGWPNNRPSNNLWPRVTKGQLSIVIHFNEKWRALSLSSQEAFRSNKLRLLWSTSSIDTSFPGLAGKDDRRYSSNGYGIVGTTYS